MEDKSDVQIVTSFTFNNSHLIIFKNKTLSIINLSEGKLINEKSKVDWNSELDILIKQIEIYENSNLVFLLCQDRKTIKIWDSEDTIVTELEFEEQIKDFKLKKEMIILHIDKKVKIFKFEIENNSETYNNFRRNRWGEGWLFYL